MSKFERRKKISVESDYDPENGSKEKEKFVKLLARFLSARNGEKQESVEDVLFNLFREEGVEKVHLAKFLEALKKTGIRLEDPRLDKFREKLKAYHESFGVLGSPESSMVDRDTFKHMIASGIILVSRAFRHQFVIPDFSSFCQTLSDFHENCKPVTNGKVADYIPQLARVDPNLWGVSVCTVDGQRFSVGDNNLPFTIQSCSKPLTYAFALEALGYQVVHKYIGQEPSGRNFNELILDYNKKPHNPMINAGAIVVCSILQTLVEPQMTLADKFDLVQNFFRKMAGGIPLGFNNSVFLSERGAADRNFALGYYLRENKCFPTNTKLQECLDFYFQCCSIEVDCEAMCVIAATLANGGICPITEEKVLEPESVRDVLSLMHSCGMYDYSGQFAFKVGIPAKSGVSGAMIMVIPNVLGICTYSPALDALGNSCRGLRFCDMLVEEYNFHPYDNLKYASNKRDPRRHKYETRGLSIVNLLFSAATGDVSALQRHRLSGLDMSLSDYDGRTALHLAAAEGHIMSVKFLLEKCEVPFDPKDRWGNTPLDEAETFKHEKVATYLREFAREHGISIET